LESSFEELGIPARILEFSSGGLRGFNVEATLRGAKGERHLWVTAHVDSVHNAGANDNASGLTSILLMAKALKELNLERTVHFVAYDLEEVGLFGSSHYIATTGGVVREREGMRRSEPAAGQVLSTTPSCKQRKSSGHPSSSGRRAWGAPTPNSSGTTGLPAAVLTDGAIYDGFPCYHKPCDTVDKLNISYLRPRIELTAAATTLLAAPQG
jgi:hypothetical protein